MRIPPPNYTQTPNDLFDYWLPYLSEGELKVLLVILRKTFGWHKNRDRISSSQLSKITGLTEETVRICAKSLAKKGVIRREVVGEKGLQSTYYEVVVSEDSNNLYGADEHGGRGGITPPGLTAPQKKHIPKETIQKKQQQQAADPAAAFSNSKIYPCLKDIPIPEHDKIEISRDYPENIVIQALKWAMDPNNPPKKCLAAQIKYACKHKITCEEKKKTPYEILCQHFKNGNFYNNAECYLKPDAIGFNRGMRQEWIKIDQFFSWKKFNETCESFGIKFNLPQH